jgi:predicted dehydrogenase
LTKLRACLIGCGDIGYGFDSGNVKREGALTHFKALSDSQKFDLCGVADINSSVLDDIRIKYKVAAYSDAAEMLSSERPDVVTIASIDDTHIPFLYEALEFTPKAVFCEKPLGLKMEDVDEIVRKYQEKGILLQVNYTRRFLDEFREIGRNIAEQEIGQVNSVTFYYSRGLVHNASHYLDLVIMYFGIPDEVSTFSSKEGYGNHDRTYSFRLSYSPGPEILFIGLEPSKLSFAEIDIVGSQGRIKFNYRNEIENYRVVSNEQFSGYKMYELISASTVRFEKALPDAYENIYEAVVSGAELKCSGQESVRLFQLINRIKNQ